ncbi:outer membrane beta-barrel protein [Sphingomonas sp. MAH-20]|uniref:Outer membrane beta-barrel protein n=1 Tax=Sphingomonas horti TaxID=2682842 RepID=A0A6I4IXE0_9SPHN|nr:MULTISPECIES: porin family protein [Sphingomonas]MBA2920866.1 porin family protein [Sphingomonas sp. CGMCC 1.13658]MVO76852.1 outer membrane beta-barrel protein [Sphingomonas horti]
MKIKLALFTLLLASGTSQPLAAQSFEGPYVGAQAGWTQNKLGRVETDLGTARVNSSKDAVAAGIFAGYNIRPADRIVLSGEAGVLFGFDDRLTRSYKDAVATINPEYSFDLGVRAGYLVTDRTLVYVRGGYENVRASVRLLDLEGPRRGKDNLDGWTVGGGVERLLTQRLSARLEYRYSDLGGSGSKFERHQALAGLAWHF